MAHYCTTESSSGWKDTSLWRDLDTVYRGLRVLETQALSRKGLRLAQIAAVDLPL